MRNQPSRQPAMVQTKYAETWNRLTTALQTTLAGKPAQFVCYCELWARCDGRPQTISATAGELGAKLGATDRAGRKWLDALRDVGLIEFADRDRRSGVLQIYVHAPESIDTPQAIRCDPQAELFAPAAGVEASDLCAHKGPSDAQRSEDLSVHKGPSETAIVLAQLQSAGEVDRDSAHASADLCAPKGPTSPPMDHGTIDHTIVPIGLAEFSESKTETVSPTETTRASAADDSAALRKLVALTGQRNEPPAPDDPADLQSREKARIVDRLLGWASKFDVPTGKRLDPARAGQIADHVLVDGFPEEQLWEFAAKVEEQWETTSDIYNPMGVFTFRLEKALRELDIPARAKSRRRPR